MTWMIYAFVVIVAAAGIHVAGKLASSGIDPMVGMLYAMGTSFLVSLFVMTFKGWSLMSTNASTKAILYSCIMGVCIGLAHYAIFFMYRSDAPLSIAVPIVRMGAAVIAVIVGVLLFKEQLTLINYAGIACAVLAVVLISR